MNHLRRMVSFLLVLVLCFGLIPGVSAAEVDTPGADTQTEATETEETAPTTVDTQPTEPLIQFVKNTAHKRITLSAAYPNKPVSRGTRVVPITMIPPPAMSCFMPWLFADV